MLQFLYGENTYAIAKDLAKIEQSFIEKDGSNLNVSMVQGSALKSGEFERNFSVIPFLGEKRLFIIKNILLEGKDKEIAAFILKRLVSMPEHLDIVFVEEGMPDGRTQLFKYLKSIPNSKYYSVYTESQLRALISEKFSKAGLSVSSEAINKLQFYLGSDYWRLSNEIEKLILFAKSEKIPKVEAALIEQMVEPENNLSIFDLTDAIGARNVQKAFISLYSLIKKGEDDFYIFNLIIGHFRKLLILDDLCKRGEALERSGMHPFVVRKMSSSLANFKGKELIKCYLLLQSIDAKIKTGQIESRVALDWLVADLCKV